MAGFVGIASWAAAAPQPGVEQSQPDRHSSGFHPPRGNAALVLIEFQNEWLGPDGKLVRLFDEPARGQVAASRAQVALAAAREAGLTIIHAPMVLSAGYPELGDGRYGLRRAIPEAETWVGSGADFAVGFEPRAGELVVRDRVGASAFVGSNLQALLRQHEIQTLYLAGFATHVCVESTLRHAHDLGYDVVVLRDACAAFNDEQDAYFDEHVLHHFGHAMTVSEFEHGLANLPESDGSDPTQTTPHERGRQRLSVLNPGAAQGILDRFETLTPRLTDGVLAFAYGEVYDPEVLDMRSRQIATVAALVALGNAEPQLRFHMHAALKVGVTPGELAAIVEQMAVYAGFPAALNAAAIAEEVLATDAVAARSPSAD
jgi:nicotinamidase-related amidase/alkylhydroperoxidase/carboxymuconolactone decarboxylase family protein YurZ